MTRSWRRRDCNVFRCETSLKFMFVTVRRHSNSYFASSGCAVLSFIQTLYVMTPSSSSLFITLNSMNVTIRVDSESTKVYKEETNYLERWFYWWHLRQHNLNISYTFRLKLVIKRKKNFFKYFCTYSSIKYFWLSIHDKHIGYILF